MGTDSAWPLSRQLFERTEDRSRLRGELAAARGWRSRCPFYPISPPMCPARWLSRLDSQGTTASSNSPGVSTRWPPIKLFYSSNKPWFYRPGNILQDEKNISKPLFISCNFIDCAISLRYVPQQSALSVCTQALSQDLGQ